MRWHLALIEWRSQVAGRRGPSSPSSCSTPGKSANCLRAPNARSRRAPWTDEGEHVRSAGALQRPVHHQARAVRQRANGEAQRQRVPSRLTAAPARVSVPSAVVADAKETDSSAPLAGRADTRRASGRGADALHRAPFQSRRRRTRRAPGAARTQTGKGCGDGGDRGARVRADHGAGRRAALVRGSAAAR